MQQLPIDDELNQLGWEWDFEREKKEYYKDFRTFESYKYKSAYDWHLFYVFHDITFLVFNDLILHQYWQFVRRLPDGTKQPVNNQEYETAVHLLCSLYDIDRQDLEKFNALPDARWTRPIYGRKKKQASSTTLALNVSSSATSAKLVKEYKRRLKELGIKQPRRREYKHPDLVYAIHANLMFGKKFSEIYQDYVADKLAGYRSTDTPTYDSYDSLRRYYAKYKTDIKSHPDT